MFTRSDARYVAKQMLKAGFHHPTICEDMETGEIRVSAHNRCWNLRTVAGMTQAQELLSTEGNYRNGRTLRINR